MTTTHDDLAGLAARESATTYVRRPDPPRLRTLPLPDGKVLLVLDRCPTVDEAQEAADSLAQVTGAWAVAFSSDIDLPQLDEPALDLTSPSDGALMAQLRSMWSTEQAEAEAWRLQGEPAVARADRLAAALTEIRRLAVERISHAGDPLSRLSQIEVLAFRALNGTS